MVQLAKDDANHLFIEYGNTGFQRMTNGKIDVMDANTQEVKTLSAAFPKLPFREQDVYWISNDGTDEINFLTANPFRLWKYSTKKGFRLRFEMKEWDKPEATSTLDYRTTGPFCMFAKGKALLKIFNQSRQYLVIADRVIPFIQPIALRSLPIGFTRQNDLLLAYINSGESKGLKVGRLSSSGNLEALPAINEFSVNALMGKYSYQAANSVEGTSSIFHFETDGLYLSTESAFLKLASKSEFKVFENLLLYQLFPDNLGNLWLCTTMGVLQIKTEKNRFAHYFTSSQQQAETNSQVRGIYSDETGRVTANIWKHIFTQSGDKMQNATNDDFKFALTKHHSKFYCGGYNLYQYNEAKNLLSKIQGGVGSEI